MSRSSIKAKLVMAQSLATFMDSGVHNATIVFYQGEIPAVTKDSPYPDNVLVTLEFPKPCSAHREGFFRPVRWPRP